jgi:hypothetical protein
MSNEPPEEPGYVHTPWGFYEDLKPCCPASITAYDVLPPPNTSYVFLPSEVIPIVRVEISGGSSTARGESSQQKEPPNQK